MIGDKKSDSSRLAGRLHLRREVGHEPMLAVHQFIRVSEIAGVPLLCAAIIAMIWANWWPEHYDSFWHSSIALSGDAFAFSRSAKHWVNDVLLPMLFFVAGMEIKRELVRGELATLQRAALPVVTALGGMIVPVGIFLVINMTGEHVDAWGIPVATDIAFVLMVLALLGDRVSSQLKILVLAFALVDDVGGVMVIAFFYSDQIYWMALALAAVPLSIMLLLLWIGQRTGAIHVILGLFFMIAMLESGVHTTIAGVILGALIPARPMFDADVFRSRAQGLLGNFDALTDTKSDLGDNVESTVDNSSESIAEDPIEVQDATLGTLEELVRGTESTIDRLTRIMNPWVSYFVLPIFALANGGIAVSAELLTSMLSSRASWGVFCGLLIGKPFGFVMAAWTGEKLGWTKLPDGVRLKQLIGTGFATGIGFTVSLFIADEALSENGGALEAVKTSVLIASILAGVIGFVIMRFGSIPTGAK